MTLKSLRDSDAIPTNRLPASASAGRLTLVAFCGVSGTLLLHLWIVHAGAIEPRSLAVAGIQGILGSGLHDRLSSHVSGCNRFGFVLA